MRCSVCVYNNQEPVTVRNITSPELARVWRLLPREVKGFDRRESSYCYNCGSSLRSRGIASAIISSYPQSKASSLVQWIRWAKTQNLTIAEINYCADLHPWLSKVPGTTLSQHAETTLRAKLANWLKGIKSEDIMNLSYANDSFDLVLHTEVIEHVTNYQQALSECRRVLKPGGICLFTVPILMDRKKTLRKAFLTHPSEEVIHLAQPSYHGQQKEGNLVFWEFGRDLITNNHLQIAFARPQDYLFVFKINK